ncbi:OmpA family protein [Aliifodinibius sp. S!AR15-10]|nr:OmpA family protein [Aliifodinibius sp. S!AR15-10]MDR8393961.1 OmpA family protein [Aliifodinibius sp. S!AR15-10]
MDYENFFNRSFLNTHALLQLKPLGGAVQPYLGTGAGFITYWENSSRVEEKGSAFHLPIQGGVDFRIAERTILTTSVTYNRTFSDGIDGFNLDDRDHDDFIVYSVGFKIALKKGNDPDRDGVDSKRDLCPDEYGESFWGCPDGDSDGILDADDECPTLAGFSAKGGCPDSDLDGIIDLKDLCPQTPSGSTGINGCPSETIDDMTESITMTPDDSTSVAGIPEDSVANIAVAPDDSAESVAVTPAENEVPKGLAELEQELGGISSNILFENNTAALDTSSYDDLIFLSELMRADINLRLIIRAYTNSAGKSNENLQLSIAQAETIKQYLVNLGIENERIYPFGYGDTKSFMRSRVELVPYYPR